MRKTVLILLALVSAGVLAASVSVTWQHPTQNTDGSAIPASGAGSLTGTRIEWGTCNAGAFGTKAGEVVVPTPATSASVPNLTPGTWCFRAYSRNTYNVESDPSGVASKVIDAPKPKPPTNFLID